MANNQGFDGASQGLALSMALGTNNCAVLGFDADGLTEGPALESSLDFYLAELLSPGLALWAGDCWIWVGRICWRCCRIWVRRRCWTHCWIGTGGDVGAELDLSSDLGSVET
jgi:hypothetical protein